MPRAPSRCSRSMRNTTCSSDPGGMVRTRMASKSVQWSRTGGNGGGDSAEIDGIGGVPLGDRGALEVADVPTVAG